MRNARVLATCVLLFCGIILNAGGAWASTAEAVLAVSEKSKTDAPLPPTSLKEDRIWNAPMSSLWEKRFFDNPLSHYNFPKGQVRASSGSGIPLKSPGKFPGITFDVEMHSFSALQSIVPPERWAKSLNDQHEQPLLLSPSHISPDYNGGFLRFTW